MTSTCAGNPPKRILFQVGETLEFNWWFKCRGGNGAHQLMFDSSSLSGANLTFHLEKNSSAKLVDPYNPCSTNGM